MRPRALAAGLLLAAGVLFLPSPLHQLGELGDRPASAAAVALLMATWWLTEALPIYWTACVPIVAFPLLGVFGRGLFGDLLASLSPYADPYIFPFVRFVAERSKSFTDRWQITVSIDPSKVTAWRGPGAIQLRTNDPEFPRLAVPLVGTVD